jgi:hypothetical protein
VIGDKVASRFAKRLRDVSVEYKTAAAKSDDPNVRAAQLAVGTTLDILASLVCEIFEVE